MRRRWVHGAVAVVSVLLFVPSYLWWSDSVFFVIALSLFAITYAAVSALEAADDSAVLNELRELRELIKGEY